MRKIEAQKCAGKRKMNTKQWDKDIAKTIKHRTVSDLLEEYKKEKENERKL